jgi:hypothetical protein
MAIPLFSILLLVLAVIIIVVLGGSIFGSGNGLGQRSTEKRQPPDQNATRKPMVGNIAEPKRPVSAHSFCPHCGVEVKGTFKFCSHCGKEQPVYMTNS